MEFMWKTAGNDGDGTIDLAVRDSETEVEIAGSISIEGALRFAINLQQAAVDALGGDASDEDDDPVLGEGEDGPEGETE